MKTPGSHRGFIKRFVERVLFRIELWNMDSMWHLTGASCFRLFPPSFYYTHTEEEIERILAETDKELQELLDMLERHKFEDLQ